MASPPGASLLSLSSPSMLSMPIVIIIASIIIIAIIIIITIVVIIVIIVIIVITFIIIVFSGGAPQLGGEKLVRASEANRLKFQSFECSNV